MSIGRRPIGGVAIRVWAILAAILVNGVTAAHAFAGHETRTEVLQETGVNMFLVGLAIGGAVIYLGLMVAIVVWWERRDEEAESMSRQRGKGDI